MLAVAIHARERNGSGNGAERERNGSVTHDAAISAGAGRGRFG
jgi:hypothetical protein